MVVKILPGTVLPLSNGPDIGHVDLAGAEDSTRGGLGIGESGRKVDGLQKYFLTRGFGTEVGPKSVIVPVTI